jgi:hypothetical protein
MPDGTPYENTLEAWQALIRASNDARYHDLVPAEDFVDRRNDEPLTYLSNECREPSLGTIGNEPYLEIASAQMPSLPRLNLLRPTILQPYHVELWCEKTTVNDVLERVALTARMCRVSIQITGKPASVSALNSHCDSGPASSPIRLKW